MAKKDKTSVKNKTLIIVVAIIALSVVVSAYILSSGFNFLKPSIGPEQCEAMFTTWCTSCKLTNFVGRVGMARELKDCVLKYNFAKPYDSCNALGNTAKNECAPYISTIRETNLWDNLRVDDFLPPQTIDGYEVTHTFTHAGIGPSASAVSWFGTYLEAKTVIYGTANNDVSISITRYDSQTDAEETSNRITNNVKQLCTVEKSTFKNQETNYCIFDSEGSIFYWWNKNNFVFSVSGEYTSQSILSQLIQSVIEKYPS